MMRKAETEADAGPVTLSALAGVFLINNSVHFQEVASIADVATSWQLATAEITKFTTRHIFSPSCQYCLPLSAGLAYVFVGGVFQF